MHRNRDAYQAVMQLIGCATVMGIWDHEFLNFVNFHNWNQKVKIVSIAVDCEI